MIGELVPIGDPKPKAIWPTVSSLFAGAEVRDDLEISKQIRGPVALQQ